MAELAAAMRAYVAATKRRVTIQYVLLAGVNDSAKHAEDLGDYLLGLGAQERLHVNLIPYNPQSRPAFAAPESDDCRAFKAALASRGFFVKIRDTKGAEKRAACGQLGNVRLRKEIRERERVANEAVSGRSGGSVSPSGCRDGNVDQECGCCGSRQREQERAAAAVTADDGFDALTRQDYGRRSGADDHYVDENRQIKLISW